MFLTKYRFPVAFGAMAVLCGATLFGLSGCGGSGGPQRASVAGNVTADGKPVDDGSISLIPIAKGGPSSGGRIAGGAYAIDRALGPVVGAYRVEIRAVRKTGRKIAAGPMSPPGTMIEETEQYLPPKYNTQSTLTAEIKPGKNQVDFELHTKP